MYRDTRYTYNQIRHHDFSLASLDGHSYECTHYGVDKKSQFYSVEGFIETRDYYENTASNIDVPCLLLKSICHHFVDLHMRRHISILKVRPIADGRRHTL